MSILILFVPKVQWNELLIWVMYEAIFNYNILCFYIIMIIQNLTGSMVKQCTFQLIQEIKIKQKYIRRRYDTPIVIKKNNKK
jgi:hypothetical protein